MPSALQQSRDILAHGVARVRAGLASSARNLNETGPEIQVEPFDARNVSTPAALIKLGTSIAAARRHRANFDAARQNVELDREKTRAEIARLRAESEYYLGHGRQTSSTATELTPYQRESIRLRERGLSDSEAARRDRDKRLGRVTAAKSEIAQIDSEAKRQAQELSTAIDPSDAFVQQVYSKDPATRARTLAVLGIDGPTWNAAVTGGYQGVLVDRARARIRAENVATTRSQVEQRFAPRRERPLSVIRQGTTGFEGDPENPLGTEDDPLGIGE